MSTNTRLTELYKLSTEKPVTFDDSSKFIIFSDCHRGDNSWADDFADNQNIFFHALNYYYDSGFTYIELGDGDELFENKNFRDIRKSYSHIFWLMSEFYKQNRFYLIYGNHDKERDNPKIVENTLFNYYDKREEQYKPLFKDIVVNESLILQHIKTNVKLFFVHGHQGDLINDTFWRLSRFFVRNIWKYLQLFFGIKDPTSPAKNYRKSLKIEKKLSDWAKFNKQILIAGHTHRPIFPTHNESFFYNSGSCVHPRCITGIEIQNNEISLIKWCIKTKNDGILYITKEILAGPKKLNFFTDSN